MLWKISLSPLVNLESGKDKMNIFDIVVVVAVAVSLIRGLYKGLVGEVSAIIGVVAGLYAGFTYYPLLAARGAQWISSPVILNLVAFFLVFAAVQIVVGLLSVLIQKLLKLVFLGWVDRTFGMVFGGAKGVLMMTVVFIGITAFIPGSKAFFEGSVTAPYLAEVSKTMTVFVSKNNRTDFLNKLKTLF